MLLKILGALFGLAVGVSEYLLLSCLTERMTGVKKGKILPFVAAKLGIYLLAVFTLFFFFREEPLFCALGYGAGMMLTALAVFALRMNKK